MPKLPHIKNNTVAQENQEQVSPDLYEVQVIPPVGIPVPELLSDEIVSITGLDEIDKMPEVLRQRSKGHTRIFSGNFVEDTTITFNMTVNLNLGGNQANQNIIYKMFKEWARRNRDERNGVLRLKPDYVGQIILDQINRVGSPWRHLELLNVIIAEITGLDSAERENGEPMQLNLQLVAEDFDVDYG